MKKVAVVGVPGKWSSEKLADAVAELSGFRCLVDPARVSLDLTTGRAWYDGLDLMSLDGLIIKKVGQVYSPKLLDRIEMLRYIASRGVRIFSSPESILRVLNRLSCTVSLRMAGIPLPPTVVTENVAEAVRAVQAFGRCVLKPLYSSKARGMVVTEPSPGLYEELVDYQASGPGHEVIYVQKLIDLPGRDLGLVFLGGRYLAAYARVGRKGAWNTTIASGGRYQAHEPGPELIDLAGRAQKIFDLDFTCVDVAETDQGPLVFEVSAFGGFRGLWEGGGLDAARAYARYAFEELGQ
ncbi:MAG: GAK system ATP-grasp enzyme [Thermodesulfobacteriota bacterium]